MITLHNDFHNTKYNVKTELGKRLSKAQIYHIRKKLCGLPCCTCGGSLGERGPQEVRVITVRFNHIILTPKLEEKFTGTFPLDTTEAKRISRQGKWQCGSCRGPITDGSVFLLLREEKDHIHCPNCVEKQTIHQLVCLE